MFWKKIKESIINISKDVIKYMFILVTFIIISMVAIYMFQKYNDVHPRGWNKFEQHVLKHPKGWNEFEQQILKEYGFIKNIEIYGYEADIFVVNISNKNMDLVEVEAIFKDMRNFLLSKEAFSSIEEYHNKKYNRNFHTIYISFYDEKKDKNLLYQFRSSGDSGKGYEDFKEWSMHIPGQDNDITINP